MLWQTARQMPGPDAISRAKAKQEQRFRRPARLPLDMVDAVGMSTGEHPPREKHPGVRFKEGALPSRGHVSETSTAVDRLCAGRVWGPDIDYRARDGGGASEKKTWRAGNMQSCLDELVFGHDMDFSHDDAEAQKHGEKGLFGGDGSGGVCTSENLANLDEWRLLSWQVQHVAARAKGKGAKSLPKLRAVFEAVATQGALSADAFTKVAMETGLCKSFHESRCAFRLFAGIPSEAAGAGANACVGTLSVDVLMEKLFGSMSPERTAVVREVWRRFDREDRGLVEMRDLLAAFDPRRLPYVRYGEIDHVEALRVFIQALGADDSMVSERENVVMTKLQDLAHNEVSAGRRPPLTGGRRSPLETAAGKPSGGPGRPSIPESRRFEKDAELELAARRPEVNQSKLVSLAEFEAYYNSISIVTQTDSVFDSIVRSPWESANVHREALAPRMLEKSKPKERIPAAYRVVAFFEDGSRRMLCLQDDTGLQEVCQGAGGTHCNQLWTWGPKVKQEVMRRLEAEGHRGIVSVGINP